jgi:hypothetical protein
MLGLVPVLSSVAVGGTHAINAEKAAIVKLLAVSNQSQCTGTVVGVRPLTVLTAFHCIGNISNGDVMVGIKNEKDAMKANPLAYMSTKAVLTPVFTGYPEYQVLQDLDNELAKALSGIDETKALISESPEDEAQKAKLKELQLAAYEFKTLYKQAMRSILNRAHNDDASTDLAILVFDRYDGELNKKSTEDLIHSGALIPISPNDRMKGKRVAFGGFGMTGEAQQTASSEIGAFTNIVQKQAGNLLATYGMLPGVSQGRIERGNMGAVLPGDSGGPLMNDFGIVGVASYIKPAPMETPTEPAPGWPKDRDGFYSYLTGRFVDLNSPKAAALFAVATITHKLSIEQNYSENLALTDLSTWGNEHLNPTPLEIQPPSVFANATAPSP